jgi:ketosteroid isomerase-like protein
MSDDDNVQIVKSMYEAIGRGDVPGLLNRVADDVDWEFLGPKELPFAGNRHGKEGVANFFAVLRETAEVKDFAIDQTVAEGDTVVVLGHERFRVKATGREWTAHWAHVHFVRDGKVWRFREHSDSAAILSAYLSN